MKRFCAIRIISILAMGLLVVAACGLGLVATSCSGLSALSASNSDNKKADDGLPSCTDCEDPSNTFESIVPENGATDVPVDTTITITFVDNVDNTTTVSLSEDGNDVDGDVNYDGDEVTFDPTNLLQYETEYTVTIGIDGDNYTSSFTTESYSDIFASIYPAHGATNVPRDVTIAITFVNDMNPASINDTTLLLSAGGTNVAGVISYADKIGTLNPNASLQYYMNYTITAKTDMKFATGGTIGSDYQWSFTTVPLTATLWEDFHGAAENDSFGISVSQAGDANDDGTIDVIIGASNTQVSGFAGSAYLYSSEKGPVLIRRFDGENPVDEFGVSVAGVGDLDVLPDNHDEVLIGAPNADPGGVNGAGRAYVYNWDGTLRYTYDGGNAGDWVGLGLTGMGDVSGDGVNDFAIGKPSDNPVTKGEVQTYDGAAGLLLDNLIGDNFGDKFGTDVAAADINNDGFDDLIVGAPWNDVGGDQIGSVLVYNSQTGALIWQVDAASDDAEFGADVSDAGDIDGDGTADFIVGAPRSVHPGAPGRAYVYSGETGEVIYELNGEADDDSFGHAVSSLGDVDGDGTDDFIVGAPGTDPNGVTNAGSVYIYSGSDGRLLQQINGAEAEANFGWCIDGIGDVNGDGRPDFIVGAPGYYNSVQSVGSAYIYISPSN